MQVAQTSKRTYRLIPRATTYERRRVPGTIIPVLYMRPYGQHGRFGNLVQQLRHRYGRRGRLDQLVQQFQQLCVRDPNVLERYPHASMLDYHKFQFRRDGVTLYFDQYAELVKQIKTNRLQIEGITSLDFCLSTNTPTPSNSLRWNGYSLEESSREESSVLGILSVLLPSLRELDLTNVCARTVLSTNVCGYDFVVQTFFQNCSLLEKITVNSVVEFGWRGTEMKAANNLKELIMDDCSFFFINDNAINDISNLDTDDEVVSKQFLLCECSSTVLERVSMRNTTMRVVAQTEGIFDDAIPQRALMKFIRNAPTTLRWFRSNLTKDNIELVRHERPGIEFLS